MSLENARAREVALPIALVVGLLANATAIGFFGGRVSQRLDQIDATIANIVSLPRDVAKLQGDIAIQNAIQDRRLDEIERNHRLFEDFTRGRIARMPYRP